MLNTKLLALAAGVALGAPMMSGSALAADGATLYVEKTCVCLPRSGRTRTRHECLPQAKRPI